MRESVGDIMSENIKKIDTLDVNFLEPLSEGSDWYCGTDYSCGDLYEAEEMYYGGVNIKPNKLIFVHRPDGTVYEPIKLTQAQYFSRPIEIDEVIYIMLVDFLNRKIFVLDMGKELGNWNHPTTEVSVIADIPLREVDDCYGLLMHKSPLMITRQCDNTFEVVWPEKAKFAVDPAEAFVYRDGDELFFSKWYEDPDYREEVVVRHFPDGEIIRTIPGTILITPDKQTWVIG